MSPVSGGSMSTPKSDSSEDEDGGAGGAAAKQKSPKKGDDNDKDGGGGAGAGKSPTHEISRSCMTLEYPLNVSDSFPLKRAT